MGNIKTATQKVAVFICNYLTLKAEKQLRFALQAKPRSIKMYAKSINPK